MFNWRKNGNGTKTICLALQGGGSYGAFVWGTLDRLLDDERLVIEGISSTSSGSINGACLATGLLEGGRLGAQQKLRAFWRGISEACHERRRPWYSVQNMFRTERWDPTSKGFFYDLMSRFLLPYDFNPRTMNPLRQVIEDTIDFEALRACDQLKLFVSATNARTNKIKVFDCANITADAICASCCLPFLFQAVEIDGEHYWDGGYVGNPPIYPLIYGCQSSDIVLVQTSPIVIDKMPESAGAILERISEISFTSTLLRELRTIAFITERIEEGEIKRRAGIKQVRMHMVETEKQMEGMGGSSKLNADWPFLEKLHDLGWKAADQWLTDNFDKLGEESTLDIRDVAM